jgi:hypothetical protein
MQAVQPVTGPDIVCPAMKAQDLLLQHLRADPQFMLSALASDKDKFHMKFLDPTVRHTDENEDNG